MNLFSFFFFFFLFHSLVLAELGKNQKKLMLNLAQVLNGTHSTWEPDPCLWKGVKCSSPNNSSVVSISLSGFGVSDSGFLSEVCKIESLQSLNLSSNLFEGSIPDTLSRLQSLEVLDLSNNNFTGKIPDSFTQMSSLTQLILSNNQLSGVVPAFSKHVLLNTDGNTGIIRNAKTPTTSTESGKGSGLIRYEATPNTPKKSGKAVKSFPIGFVAGFIVGTVLLVVFLAYRRFYKNKQPQSRNDFSLPEVIQGNLITANGIHRSFIDFNKAVEEVSKPRNIVLKTRLSTYYKVTMPSGISYFVKKLIWSVKTFQLAGNAKFEHDLQMLGKLSHSNVMIPLAYMLTSDGAYLFYEFAPMDTLFDSLQQRTLDWETRYSIAVGVAQGLAFLHGCTSNPVLLNLSSRNIMLRSLKEPQVSDIELYKVIDLSCSANSRSTAAGSFGYTPPEYTMRVTTAGNVYSFGVVLLELLTGKPAVSKGTELAKWVLRNLEQHYNQDRILDSTISKISLPVRNQMLSVLQIAVACVNASPEARPKMDSVLRMLLNAC